MDIIHIEKRYNASIRKKERRKERQRIARHLNEATLFSMHVS